MTVEQEKKIDIIYTEEDESEVVVAICDHLPWDMEDHILILQEKINSYITFILGGQIYEDYPDSKDKKITIQVYALHEFTDEALEFLENVKEFLSEHDIGFKYEVSDVDPESLG